MGGLSRKYTVIREIKENESIDNLLLDSGNFLFSKSNTSHGKNVSTLKATGIAKIYREMNYDAVNIGHNDLAAGIDYLLELDFLPWTSANIYDNKGKAIFKPYILKTGGQLKYAIIGLSSPFPEESSKYVYHPWKDVLPSLLEELRSNVDCIILLSSLSERENQEIAQKFPDIRLIFSAVPTSANVVPKIINKSIITQTANRGKYLGQLYIHNPGLYEWANATAPNSADVEKQRKAMEYRLSRIEYLITENENNQKTIQVLEKQKSAISKQLKALEQKMEGETTVPQSTFKASFTPLTKNIKESRMVNKMIGEIKKQLSSPKS